MWYYPPYVCNKITKDFSNLLNINKELYTIRTSILRSLTRYGDIKPQKHNTSFLYIRLSQLRARAIFSNLYKWLLLVYYDNIHIT